MKKNNITILAMFLLVAFSFKKTIAKEKLTIVVDTFKIEEATIVDSSIIPILDSALTFVRTPALEFGTYYYSLTITRLGDRSSKNVASDSDFRHNEITLYVTDYLVIDSESLEDFKKKKKMLFNYKGIPLLVYDFDNIANRFFKPSANKSDYYYYHKVAEKDRNAIIVPKKTYSQQAGFIIGTNYFIFLSYKILYALWDESGSMIIRPR